MAPKLRLIRVFPQPPPLPLPPCPPPAMHELRPIHPIVSFPAGSTTDIVAHLAVQKLSEAWGRPMIVDNRAGAGGNIGSAMVAKAAPDGYTLLMGTVGTHTINASLYAKMPMPITC